MPTNIVSNDRTSPYWEAGALWHNPMYDDLQVGINNIAKGASAPTDRTYNHGIAGGIAYPVLGFSKNNYIWFDVQTSHTMKLSTPLECHIHFILLTRRQSGIKLYGSWMLLPLRLWEHSQFRLALRIQQRTQLPLGITRTTFYYLLGTLPPSTQRSVQYILANLRGLTGRQRSMRQRFI
jgi:hypothetical protein